MFYPYPANSNHTPGAVTTRVHDLGIFGGTMGAFDDQLHPAAGSGGGGCEILVVLAGPQDDAGQQRETDSRRLIGYQNVDILRP